MAVAIIDVGSNTVRLLVASRKAGRLAHVREERAYLGLGADLECSGRIPDEKIMRAARVARRYTRIARRLSADLIDVIVTAPGRQSANRGSLVAALELATGARVSVLSEEEEGRLAYEGAVAASSWLPASVAVCDVGGGSTELVVGTPENGPAWWRSLDVGSIRLAERFFAEDPPNKGMIAAARAEVERRLTGLVPPLPLGALATGGSARALRKLVGRSLGPEELEEAIRILRRRPSAAIAKAFDVDPLRARTLAGGAVVLAEMQRRLNLPFEVSRGGLREGAALGLLADLAAA